MRRGLELVGDGVDKGVMLFVAANLTYEKDGIQGHARNENRETKHPEEHQHTGPSRGAPPSPR